MNFFEKMMAFLGFAPEKQQHSTGQMYASLGGMQTVAGGYASVDMSLALSAVWACVRRLSETISTMPIQVFERTADGNRAVDYQHPLQFVLHDSPNADMTSIEFWQAMQCCVELWGNAYASKQQVGGELVGLNFLRPERMQVRKLTDGRIQYLYAGQSGRQEFFDDDILHVKGMTLDGVLGLSTISYMRNTVGIGQALETTAGDVFKNGMRPSGVFNVPHQLKENQREAIQKKIDVFKQDRNGGILVTELGEKYTPISVNPEDAQLLASRSWSVEEICRWFGVPPYLVGYTEKSTSWGTGMEQQNSTYLMYSILPRIRKIEQAIERTLIAPSDRRRFFVRFNYEGLLRADSKTRAEVHQIEVRNGIRSRNEVRELENLPPYENGGIYTVESNLATVERVIAGETNNTVRLVQ